MCDKYTKKTKKTEFYFSRSKQRDTCSSYLQKWAFEWSKLVYGKPAASGKESREQEEKFENDIVVRIIQL